MATRICPQCSAQYVATVRRCIDCDVVLVEERGDAERSEMAATPVGDGDQIGYELEGWGNQLKVALEGMLDNAGIHRAWEAGALVVGAQDEDAVDELIATLEGGDLVELEDDTPRVALEIEGLDADAQAELDARLLADAVPHAWDDDGSLVVAEVDEERVLAIVGDVLDGPVGDGDGDGLAATEALTALFVAVDRLGKHPDDAKAIAALTAATSGLEGLAVPYGFAATDWEQLVAEAEDLDRRLTPAVDEVEADGEPEPEDGEPEPEDGEPEPEDGEEAEDGEAGGDEPVGEAIARLRDRLTEIV